MIKIFWINWGVTLVATPLIWYCWFMTLRIIFFSDINYEVSKYKIQDEIARLLAALRLIRFDEWGNTYVPQSRFRLLNYATFGYVGVMMGAAVLVAFCYYGVSRYGVEIPTKPVCISAIPTVVLMFLINLASKKVKLLMSYLHAR